MKDHESPIIVDANKPPLGKFFDPDVFKQLREQFGVNVRVFVEAHFGGRRLDTWGIYRKNESLHQSPKKPKEPQWEPVKGFPGVSRREPTS